MSKPPYINDCLANYEMDRMIATVMLEHMEGVVCGGISPHAIVDVIAERYEVPNREALATDVGYVLAKANCLAGTLGNGSTQALIDALQRLTLVDSIVTTNLNEINALQPEHATLHLIKG